MPTAPSIHIIQASLRYQNTLLFDNLDLTLPGGKWTCLLGQSGVGKSSLLRLIAGLTSAVGLESTIQTSDNLPLSGRLVYMAQDDLLMPWCSALDNVLLGVRLRGENPKSSEHQHKAFFLLEKVGLKNAINKKPAELSGGMRQRVAIARTLMEDRPVVLMDEPFASLDAITRLRLQELAAELLSDRTVLLVTHDPMEALRLGDEIYVMTGLPATVGAPIFPTGKAPRDLRQAGLFELQTELLRQLAFNSDA